MPHTSLIIICATLLLSGCDLLQSGAKVTCVAGMVDDAVSEVAVLTAKVEHNETAPDEQKTPVVKADIGAIVDMAFGLVNKNLCQRSDG